MQILSPSHVLYQQILCVLKAVGVSYIDCNGNLIGDCSTCASSDSGEGTTNTITFNPASNTITTVVNGIASSTVIALDAGDVVTTSALTINGTLYPAGTSIQTIVTALVAVLGTPVTVTDSVTIDLTLTGQNIQADLQSQGAMLGDVLNWNGVNWVPATLPAGILPPGSSGSVLVHDGVGWTSVSPITEAQTGLTGFNVTLAAVPLSYADFTLYRNGVYQVVTTDFTRAGAVVTFVTNSLTAIEKITAKYYI